MKKNILVAGGTGLLGSELTRLLLKRKNYFVVSSYYKSNPPKELKKKYKKYNFLKIRDCLKATKNKQIVFICAVKAGGIKHMSINPLQNLNENIQLRLNLFNACMVNKVRKVVWVSSSTVYQPSTKPIKENQLNLNQATYPEYFITGNNYRYLESLVKFYQKKIDVSVIRTTSIYGPRDNFDPEKSHVVPALIKKILEKKAKIINVWGSPDVVRDFVYVNDLAKACVLVANKKKIPFINFSSGLEVTIKELLETILKVSNSNLKYKFNFKLGSAPYRVLNNNLFNKMFKDFKRTDLEKGLKKTIEWYTNEKKYRI